MARYFFAFFTLFLTFFRPEFPLKTKRKLKKASYVKLICIELSQLYRMFY